MVLSPVDSRAFSLTWSMLWACLVLLVVHPQSLVVPFSCAWLTRGALLACGAHLPSTRYSPVEPPRRLVLTRGAPPPLRLASRAPSAWFSPVDAPPLRLDIVSWGPPEVLPAPVPGAPLGCSLYLYSYYWLTPSLGA
eukprot:Gb_19474 [translate_table: standard]